MTPQTPNKKLKLKFLKLEKQENESIWILAIDNPPANVLTLDILEELDRSIDDFNLDSVANILILTAVGERAFSSGADINEILTISTGEQGAALASRGQRLCDKIENTDKPIIAAIKGLCVGGGAEIAMACHIRVASQNAKFGQPEVNLGIIPGFGGTQRLPRIIGASRARKLILTGDLISAEEAFGLGLVDVVVVPDQLLRTVLGLARRIGRNGQISVRLAQKAIREGLCCSLAEGLRKEIECFRKVCESEDMIEGLRAFKEKRPPNFKNR